MSPGKAGRGRRERLRRPRDVVDNCRIDDLLGAGGFGAVFRAYHLSLEGPRALGWSRSRRQFDSPREMAIDLGFRCARMA